MGRSGKKPTLQDEDDNEEEGTEKRIKSIVGKRGGTTTVQKDQKSAVSKYSHNINK